MLKFFCVIQLFNSSDEEYHAAEPFRSRNRIRTASTTQVTVSMSFQSSIGSNSWLRQRCILATCLLTSNANSVKIDCTRDRISKYLMSITDPYPLDELTAKEQRDRFYGVDIVLNLL